jgi:hypothetical protein
MDLRKERECNLHNGYGWLVGYMIESPTMAWEFKFCCLHFDLVTDYNSIFWLEIQVLQNLSIVLLEVLLDNVNAAYKLAIVHSECKNDYNIRLPKDICE